MIGKILFADNDVLFLNTRAEFLERAGYDVLKAATLSEAEWLLKNANVHLAVLDVRMENDDDEHDKSGLSLAKKPAYRSIPKIILTDHTYYDAVREALREGPGHFRPAVDVIRKEAGPGALLETVKTAFEEYVRINWNLDIQGKARDSFMLARLIEPSSEGELLLGRAAELTDLFRRLFYEEEQIRVERILWEREGRVALVVYAFRDAARPESFVVVCGQNAAVSEEARRFKKYAPKAPSETGTKLNAKTETTHFAANAYAFASNDLERVQTLGELYQSAPSKVWKDALTTLFERTLTEWHQNRPVYGRNSLAHLYRQQVERQVGSFQTAQIEEVASVIENKGATLGVKIDRIEGRVHFNFNHRSFSYVNPLPLLAAAASAADSDQAPIVNIPGTLTGDNILVDELERTLLTDFADAGTAPLLWNFVTLEAMIRFDWVEPTELLRRQELENSLVNTDFVRPDLRDLDSKVRKPAQAIIILRNLAARSVGQNVLDYHLGIFFQAAYRLANHRLSARLTTGELIKLTHIWLAMAMTAEKIIRERGLMPTAAANQSHELRILDERARKILIGDQEISLPRQRFTLFQYLYRRANQVCTKEELLEEALQGKYDEANLHTLIGRIRKDLQDDADRPRYLFTEKDTGYRLVPQPDSHS